MTPQYVLYECCGAEDCVLGCPRLEAISAEDAYDHYSLYDGFAWFETACMWLIPGCDGEED
jgi:hypothetical protein